MSARAVLVALLVVASGCQFLAGDGRRAGTPTATPAPVPTATAVTTSGPDLPPGVSGGGVTDVTMLAAAHVDAAVGTSYVWRDRWRTTAGNGTVPARASRREVRLVNGTYYRVEVLRETSLNFTTAVERFADGEYRYSRGRSLEGRTDRYTVEPVGNASVTFAREVGGSIRAFLDVPDARVAVVRVDGDRRYRITAHEDVYEPVGGYNYSVRAVVSPDGFVQRLAVSYGTGPGDASTIRRYSFEYTRVGTATVRRPPWIDDARAKLRAVDTPAVPRTPIAIYLSSAAGTRTETDAPPTGTAAPGDVEGPPAPAPATGAAGPTRLPG